MDNNQVALSGDLATSWKSVLKGIMRTISVQEPTSLQVKTYLDPDLGYLINNPVRAFAIQIQENFEYDDSNNISDVLVLIIRPPCCSVFESYQNRPKASSYHRRSQEKSIAFALEPRMFSETLCSSRFGVAAAWPALAYVFPCHRKWVEAS